MRFQEFLPTPGSLNLTLFSECLDNPVYGSWVEVDSKFIEFISYSMTSPKPVLLFHLQDQFFDIYCYLLSSRFFMLEYPEILNKPTLPVQKRRRFYNSQMVGRSSGKLETQSKKKSIIPFQGIMNFLMI